MVRAATIDVAEVFVMRLLIAIYVIFAHFAMFVFWFSGLKIAYINHRQWPYKKMWKDFRSGDFEEKYDDDVY